MGGITQGRVQTGNAVPVLVAKTLSKQLKKMFEGKRLKGFRGDLVQEDLFQDMQDMLNKLLKIKFDLNIKKLIK